MNPCCKLSLFQGARYVAIAEFIYAVLATLFTTFELISTSTNGIAIRNKSIDLFNTFIPHVLITYLVLSLVNIVLSIVLYIGITTDNIQKSRTYVITSIITSSFGLATLVYHGIHLSQLEMSILQAEFFISVAYHGYKPYGLFVIVCFVRELELLLQGDEDAEAARKRLRYQSLDSNGADDTQHYEVAKHIFFGIPFAAKHYVPASSFSIDYDGCVEYDDHTSTLRATLKPDSPNTQTKQSCVRTLKTSSRTETRISELLREARLLLQLGPHQHVLQLLGVHCEEPPDDNSRRGTAFLFFAAYNPRRLDDFLRKSFENRLQNFQSEFDEKSNDSRRKRMGTVYENVECVYSHSLEPFSSNNMVQWAYQIASAIEFLHSKNIIFGNLQARRVLLHRISHVKLTGFSLASELHANDNTISSLYTPGLISWRWTALECLVSTNQGLPIRFTEKTDVWAYGCTVYEVFSMGQPPNMTSNLSEYISALVKGKRPEKPAFSSNGIYKLMRTCWEADPLERPGINVVALFFRQLLSRSIVQGQ